MKKFYITMMCASCKWKISEELKNHGYKGFNIDLNNNILTFNEEVNPKRIINIVSNIRYKIEEIEDDNDLLNEYLQLM